MMYYVYKQPDSLPCVTEREQNGMELIGKAESAENAKKILYNYLNSLSQKHCDGIFLGNFGQGKQFIVR
ncbi:hypothetical protein [Candidatus Pseudoruminococcus sp.]|uniref:hypothetical protein n=1 Tax=Candidatus Pseudoruminococcus sp. TaxID=3101048 RepID=UPI003999BF2C